MGRGAFTIATVLVAFTISLIGGCTGGSRRQGARPAGPSAAAVPEPEEGIPHAPGRYFEAESFHEDALAGPHEHGLVRLGSIPLLVIRDEDVFRTPPDRAQEVARVLQEALHMGDRFFILADEGDRPAIYSVSHHGGYPRLVLRVTRGDAVAYAHRSGRALDQRLLAEWWLAMLKNVVAVVFFDEPPPVTMVPEASESLRELRERLWVAGQVAPVSPDRLATAAAGLSPEARRGLRTLAFTVPRGFVGLPEARRRPGSADVNPTGR